MILTLKLIIKVLNGKLLHKLLAGAKEMLPFIKDALSGII